MVCAGLRLTAQQELIRLGVKEAIDDFKADAERANDFHEAVLKEIDVATAVATVVSRFGGYDSLPMIYAMTKGHEHHVLRYVQLDDQNFLGAKVNGDLFFDQTTGSELSAEEVKDLAAKIEHSRTYDNVPIARLEAERRVSLAHVNAILKINTYLGEEIISRWMAVYPICGSLCDYGLIPDLTHPESRKNRFPGMIPPTARFEPMFNAHTPP